MFTENDYTENGKAAMYHVLMVCTGNICRSPMAAGLASHLLPERLRDRVQITSAGVSALQDHPAEPNAIAAMSEIGIDISSHRARQITRRLVGVVDLILTMEVMQREIVRDLLLPEKEKVRLLTDFCPHSREPDIKDPYGGPLVAYQVCRDTLLPCVKALITWLDSKANIE